MQSAQTEMKFCRADRPVDSVDFVLAFRPHSDLLAKNVYCIGQAGLLNVRFARLASKPAGEHTGQNTSTNKPKDEPIREFDNDQKPAGLNHRCLVVLGGPDHNTP